MNDATDYSEQDFSQDNGGYEDDEDEDEVKVVSCENETQGRKRDRQVEVTVLRKNDDPYTFYKCLEIKPITKHLPNFISQAKRALKVNFITLTMMMTMIPENITSLYIYFNESECTENLIYYGHVSKYLRACFCMMYPLFIKAKLFPKSEVTR